MDGKKRENKIIMFLSLFLLIFLFLGFLGFINFLKNLDFDNKNSNENKEEEKVEDNFKFKEVEIKNNSFGLTLTGKTVTYTFDKETKDITINGKVIYKVAEVINAYTKEDTLLLSIINEDTTKDVLIINSEGNLITRSSEIIKDYENNFVIQNIIFESSNFDVSIKTEFGLCENVDSNALIEKGNCSLNEQTSKFGCSSVNDKVLEATLSFTYKSSSQNKYEYSVKEEKTLFYCYQKNYEKIDIAQ